MGLKVSLLLVRWCVQRNRSTHRRCVCVLICFPVVCDLCSQQRGAAGRHYLLAHRSLPFSLQRACVRARACVCCACLCVVVCKVVGGGSGWGCCGWGFTSQLSHEKGKWTSRQHEMQWATRKTAFVCSPVLFVQSFHPSFLFPACCQCPLSSTAHNIPSYANTQRPQSSLPTNRHTHVRAYTHPPLHSSPWL